MRKMNADNESVESATKTQRHVLKKYTRHIKFIPCKTLLKYQ